MDRNFLYSVGDHSWNHSVEQAGLEVPDLPPPLSLSPGVKGMCYQHPDWSIVLVNKDFYVVFRSLKHETPQNWK